jgi:hypothetical protein
MVVVRNLRSSRAAKSTVARADFLGGRRFFRSRLARIPRTRLMRPMIRRDQLRPRWGLQ